MQRDVRVRPGSGSVRVRIQDLEVFKPILDEVSVRRGACNRGCVTGNDRCGLKQCHAMLKELAKMSRVFAYLLPPQDDESDGQIYSRQKTPLVRLHGTSTLLSEVLGDMVNPRRSGGIPNYFLNEEVVGRGDCLWARRVIGVPEWLGQTLHTSESRQTAWFHYPTYPVH